MTKQIITNKDTTPPPLTKWDKRFLRMAEEVRTWSKDRSTKVGSVIVDGKQLRSIGFNGMPAGICDDCEERHERPAKYFYFTHAEQNAIANFPCGKPKGCTIYVTHFPCAMCARDLINNGISRLVTIKRDTSGFDERWKADMDAALEMLREVGIIVDSCEESELKE